MLQVQPNPRQASLPQRRWSTDEYHRMIAAGILTSNDRVELLAGQIIEMVPQEPPHASTTLSLGNDFVLLFADKAWVRQQLPITIELSRYHCAASGAVGLGRVRGLHVL